MTVYYNLIINPGSTSTKLAVYDKYEPIACKYYFHNSKTLVKYKSIYDQTLFRYEIIKDFLKECNISKNGDQSLANVMGRGGIVLTGLDSGAYLVDDNLFSVLNSKKLCSPHASNLGGILAKKIADDYNIKAYIYDSVVSGNIKKVAKITGFSNLEKLSVCHALNMRAIGKEYSNQVDIKFEKLNLIVAHLGGGCTVAALKNGSIIDNVADDEYHFSPERSGSTQLLSFIDKYFDKNYSCDQVKKIVRGKGGLFSYFDTNDCKSIEENAIKGDYKSKIILDAFAYQLSKSISMMSVALQGSVDAIILTGPIANSLYITKMIRSYVSFISKVIILPGEKEMEALGHACARLQTGKEKYSVYK